MAKKKAKQVLEPLNDVLKVTLSMRVEGQTTSNEHQFVCGRNQTNYVMTLNELARTLYALETRHFPHSTYAVDTIKEYERVLPAEDGETAESLFAKYWVNRKETVKAEFDRINAGGASDHFYPAENDLLKYRIASECNGFLELPLPLKQAFVYWLLKYVSKPDKLQADGDACPEFVKEWIDSQVEEK